MSDKKELLSGSSAFALLLYQKLAKDNVNNIFVSPYSISATLGMVFLGSKGIGSQEIKDGLQLGELCDEDFQSGLFKILETLSSQTDITLKIANKLFPDKSLQIKDDFIQKCVSFCKSTLEQLNFAESPETSRNDINTWVQKETANKIKDLLPSGSITSDSRLVLANAVYFKGNWLNKFQEKETMDMDFHKSENETISVRMMIQKRKFNTIFDKDLQAQVVELPYQGEEFSMVLIVPSNHFGLAKLETSLTGEKLNSLISSTKNLEIVLGLPKMNLEYEIELIPILQKMGINNIFNRTEANLQGISCTPNLFVSGVFHKAFVEVNEEGSEAAAATGLVMMPMCIPLPPPTIMCDHPFMFCIYHKPSQVTLFIGRYTSP